MNKKDLAWIIHTISSRECLVCFKSMIYEGSEGESIVNYFEISGSS